MERIEWLEERKKGLGGSDASAILGMNPWKTALDVWLEKTGKVSDDDDNEVLYWGRALEAPIVARFAEEHPELTVGVPPKICKLDGTPLFASTDRLAVPVGSLFYLIPPRSEVFSGPFSADLIVVEAKTSRSAKGWGEAGTDDVPGQYLIQCEHYMAVTGAQIAMLPVLIGCTDYREYEVRRDEEMCQMLIGKLTEWWDTYVVKGVEPPPSNGADVEKLFPQSAARKAFANLQVEEACAELAVVNQEIKDIEGRKEELEDQIKIAIGEADTLVTSSGEVLATWKTSKGSKRVDVSAIPTSVASQYMKEFPGSRRFNLKLKSE